MSIGKNIITYKNLTKVFKQNLCKFVTVFIFEWFKTLSSFSPQKVMLHLKIL